MIFVYYEDGYCGNGDHGMEEFTTKDEATAFIESRLSQDSSRNLSMYKLIEGKRLDLKSVEVITRVECVE